MVVRELGMGGAELEFVISRVGRRRRYIFIQYETYMYIECAISSAV